MTFTKEELVSGLSSRFPTFDFRFVDNEDGSFVMTANGVTMKSVVWSETIGEKLWKDFVNDNKSDIFLILELTVCRYFDFDGTNWVEAKPKSVNSRELGFYGCSFMDTGKIYCPYIPIYDSSSKQV